MDKDQLTALAVEIVAAHVSNNKVPAEDVPALLRGVCAALADFTSMSLDIPISRVPAVTVEESVADDHLICLACGNQHRTLTRHLKTAHGMSPRQYRGIFGLAEDYPMNAASYSALRGRLARAAGLGTGGHSRQRKILSRDRQPAPEFDGEVA